MQVEKKLNERVLDSSLLAGSIDVDDYATALLTQHSLEHANRELERLRKELEQMKKEKSELLEKGPISDNGLESASSEDKFTEQPDKKRKYPEVAALYESRSNALSSLEPLARVQSHVDWSEKEPGQAPGVDLWYSDIFSEELKVLRNVEQKVAATQESLPSKRERALEDELIMLKKEHEHTKELLANVMEEKDELADMSKALEAQLETVSQERDELLDTRQSYENELAQVTEERDDLARNSQDLEMQHRSLQELNKALTQKIALLEENVRTESTRALRAYNHIFHLARNAEKRQILQDWRSQTVGKKQATIAEEKAARFHEHKLLSKVLGAWGDYVYECRCEKNAEAKLKVRRREFLVREWGRGARKLVRSRRTAELFARMKEAQALRESFRAWRKVAHAAAVSTSGETMTLATLRSVAAKERVPAMMYAASRGMTDLVLELINEGSPVNMKERTTGSTPLHAAAVSGSVTMVEILLEASADPATTDNSGQTPLQKLVRQGKDASVEVARTLLRHGADPAFVSPKDGRSLLHLAVDCGTSVEFVTALLQYHASIEQQHPSTGRTALHAAAERGDFTILDAMLKHALELRNNFVAQFPVDTVALQTPLHVACASVSPDMPKCIEALVEAGFDVSAKNSSGQTPLHVLCQNTSALPSALKPFLVANDLLNEQDKNKNTPLHYACKANIRGVAQELVANGAAVFYVNEDKVGPLDLVAPAFAITLLGSIRSKPIMEHAERAHRDLDTCMICKNKVDTRRFIGRGAVHCGRCGRYCCSTCGKYNARLQWPAQMSPTSSTIGSGTSPLSSSFETQQIMMSSDKEVKVCEHCAKVLMAGPELGVGVDNV